jgi:beta-glucosidase
MDVRDAVEAGNCWMTPGSMDDTYVQPIVDGVKTGRTRLERLRENVAYILKTMIRFA